MSQRDDRWPFGTSDGGPLSRPVVVDLDGVLIAILEDAAAGERARASLQEIGLSDAHLRLYSDEQILAADAVFRANRNLGERLIGALVDDGESMAQYVEYATRGCSALWVLTSDRDEADRVVRQLSDQPVLHIWYHGHDGVETLHMA